MFPLVVGLVYPSRRVWKVATALWGRLLLSACGGRLLPFRMGAMKICLRAGLPVVPFSIDGSARVNPRNGFRIRPGTMRMSFGELIPAERVALMSLGDLHDRVREAIVRRLRGDVAPDGESPKRS
jgi:1-acyl-sn-glycerol-3-phosphate acyltransferase